MQVLRFRYTEEEKWVGLPGSFQDWDSESTMVLAFFAPQYGEQSQCLEELSSFFPKSHLIGCSTSGEIHGQEIHDKSVSVAVVRLEEGHVKTSIKDIQCFEESKTVGEQIAKELVAEDLKGIVVLSEGIHANGALLIEGINSQIDPTKTTIGGGLAGDGSDFKKTWIWSGQKPSEKKVVAVGIYGESVYVSGSSRGGWDIFGPERTITKSKGNVVYEIDGKPALDLYKTYLGEKAKDLPVSGLFFPLQIRPSLSSEERLVRTVSAVCEEEQSITFVGDIPEGHRGQLMKANFDRVIDAAGDAASKAQTAMPENSESSNSLCLAISCVGRRLVLGERAEEEIEVLSESLNVEEPNLLGFYSYGELGSQDTGKPCDLHNQSMTVFTILEKASQEGKKAA